MKIIVFLFIIGFCSAFMPRSPIKALKLKPLPIGELSEVGSVNVDKYVKALVTSEVAQVEKGLLNSMSSEFKTFRDEAAAFRSEVSDEFKDINDEFKTIRSEAAAFRSEVSDEFKDINDEFNTIRSEAAAFRSEVSDKFKDINDEFKAIRSEAADFRSEVKAEFKALRTDLNSSKWWEKVSIFIFSAVFSAFINYWATSFLNK